MVSADTRCFVLRHLYVDSLVKTMASCLDAILLKSYVRLSALLLFMSIFIYVRISFHS